MSLYEANQLIFYWLLSGPYDVKYYFRQTQKSNFFLFYKDVISVNVNWKIDYLPILVTQ